MYIIYQGTVEVVVEGDRIKGIYQVGDLVGKRALDTGEPR